MKCSHAGHFVRARRALAVTGSCGDGALGGGMAFVPIVTFIVTIALKKIINPAARCIQKMRSWAKEGCVVGQRWHSDGGACCEHVLVERAPHCISDCA